MSDKTLLEISLDSLKHRLAKNNNLIEIYKGEGSVEEVTCTFQEPVSEAELEEFVGEFNLCLPEDYKKFLLLHNGARLFLHPQHGGEFDLFGLKLMREMLSWYGMPEEWLAIGYHYGHDLIIDMEYVKQGRKDYLLYRDSCEQFGRAYEMGLNFELWLERSIICQGAGFWDWSDFTVQD